MDRSARRAPTHGYPRTARVNALLLEILAEAVERISDADERLAMVTLTAVDCAPDLRSAVVYCSTLNDEAREGLEEHRRALQRRVGEEARIRRTPTLRFAADPAIEAGERIEAAIRRAREHPPEGV
jgi:ribosome-binding factor A